MVHELPVQTDSASENQAPFESYAILSLPAVQLHAYQSQIEVKMIVLPAKRARYPLVSIERHSTLCTERDIRTDNSLSNLWQRPSTLHNRGESRSCTEGRSRLLTESHEQQIDRACEATWDQDRDYKRLNSVRWSACFIEWETKCGLGIKPKC